MSLFLHQTTTVILCHCHIAGCICLSSYIKPQLILMFTKNPNRCICLSSYIKPQLFYDTFVESQTDMLDIAAAYRLVVLYIVEHGFAHFVVGGEPFAVDFLGVALYADEHELADNLALFVIATSPAD